MFRIKSIGQAVTAAGTGCMAALDAESILGYGRDPSRV